MLTTGSINTLSTAWADRTKAEGRDADNGEYKFDHPFFQAAGMFVGELTCLAAFYIRLAQLRGKKDEDGEDVLDEAEKPENQKWSPTIFMIPAACDMTGTSLMYVGLTMTSASIFQMLRGSVVIFTGILSVVFLKRKLQRFHWFSMFLVLIGVAVVGLATLIVGGDDSTTTVSQAVKFDHLSDYGAVKGNYERGYVESIGACTVPCASDSDYIDGVSIDSTFKSSQSTVTFKTKLDGVDHKDLYTSGCSASSNCTASTLSSMISNYTGTAVTSTSLKKATTSSDEKDAGTQMLGNGIIIIAQIVTAIQMVIEEKFVGGQNVPALQAVGWEGCWGLCFISVVLVAMYFIPDDSHKTGKFEDSYDAMTQISNSWKIALATCGNVMSIAFFNFFGISVTKAMSAAHRMVIDSVRTL